MRKILVVPLLFILALSLFTPTSASIAAPQDDAPRISLADAKKMYDDGNAFFVDARAEDSYKAEHIKGAVNITADTLKDKLKDLPKNKTIVAYCT